MNQKLKNRLNKIVYWVIVIIIGWIWAFWSISFRFLGGAYDSWIGYLIGLPFIVVSFIPYINTLPLFIVLLAPSIIGPLFIHLIIKGLLKLMKLNHLILNKLNAN